MATASHRWRLCGRAEEYKTLEEFYLERRYHDVVFVTGSNGCGKTSLIASLSARIQKDAGYLLHGEFLQDSAPYEALGEVFTCLEQQIRQKRDSKSILKDLRQGLQKQEVNASLLLQAFPSLKFLLVQKKSNSTEPTSSSSIPEAHQQQRDLVRNLVLMFQVLSANFPIVLALDNAMWADLDTLQFLKTLKGGPSIRNFLCVVLSREDIQSRLEDYGNDQAEPEPPSQCSQIHLSRLGKRGVADIICNALGVPNRKEVAEIVHFVHRETGGNPFYAQEMIKAFVSEGYVTKNEQGTWVLQTSMPIQSLHDLLLTPFHRLPAHLKDVAQAAASFEGRTIHHSILSQLVTSLSADKVMESIIELKSKLGVTDSGGNFFYFPYGMQKLIHEKYNLAERKAMHQHVLRSLYRHLSPEVLDDNVFLVLHQSLRSQWFRSTANQKMKLARLCLVAAKRSMASLAPSSAESYIQKGITCLLDVEDRWRLNYDLTLELWTQSAELEFAHGNHEMVHSRYLEIAQHCRQPLDVVPACRVHVLSLGETGKVDQALEVGLKWICQLGESSEQSMDLRQTLTDLIKARKLVVSSASPNDDDEYNPLNLLRESAKSLRNLESWGNNYERCLSLFNTLLETEYVLGNYEEAKDAIGVVLQHARDPQDKCAALYTQLELIVQTSNRDHSLGARESIKLLASYGIKFPLNASKKDVMVEKLKLKAALGRRDLSVLVTMDLMERDCLLKLIDQLVHFATSSANENLTAVVALRAMRLSLKMGISKYLPQILITYAVPLRRNGKLEDAYELSFLVEKLCERFPQQNPKFQLLLQSGTLHLKKPFYSSVDLFADLYGVALADADVEYAMILGMHVPLLHYASGLPLTKTLESQLCMFEEKAAQLDKPTFVALFMGFRQFLHNLQGKCSKVLDLNGDVMDEEAILCKMEGNSRQMTLRDFSVLRLTLACIFGDSETMIVMLDRLKSVPLFDAPIVREHTRMTYIGIAALMLARTSKDRQYKKLGQQIVKEFKKLNDIGSKNARPVYLCLRAIEKYTVESYEKAIRACRDAKMLHLAAMMNEQCGLMLLDARSYGLGMEYLGSALWLYSDWGAEGKVQQMRQKFDISERSKMHTSYETMCDEVLAETSLSSQEGSA